MFANEVGNESFAGTLSNVTEVAGGDWTGTVVPARFGDWSELGVETTISEALPDVCCTARGVEPLSHDDRVAIVSIVITLIQPSQ